MPRALWLLISLCAALLGQPARADKCDDLCLFAFNQQGACADLVDPETNQTCACGDLLTQCTKKATACADENECTEYKCQQATCSGNVCEYAFLDTGAYVDVSCDVECKNGISACVGGRCKCVHCLVEDDCKDKVNKLKECTGLGRCEYFPVPDSEEIQVVLSVPPPTNDPPIGLFSLPPGDGPVAGFSLPPQNSDPPSGDGPGVGGGGPVLPPGDPSSSGPDDNGTVVLSVFVLPPPGNPPQQSQSGPCPGGGALTDCGEGGEGDGEVLVAASVESPPECVVAGDCAAGQSCNSEGFCESPPEPQCTVADDCADQVGSSGVQDLKSCSSEGLCEYEPRECIEAADCPDSVGAGGAQDIKRCTSAFECEYDPAPIEMTAGPLVAPPNDTHGEGGEVMAAVLEDSDDDEEGEEEEESGGWRSWWRKKKARMWGWLREKKAAKRERLAAARARRHRHKHRRWHHRWHHDREGEEEEAEIECVAPDDCATGEICTSEGLCEEGAGGGERFDSGEIVGPIANSVFSGNSVVGPDDDNEDEDDEDSHGKWRRKHWRKKWWQGR